MTLGERQCAFSHALCLLIAHAEELGYDVSVREVGRTSEQQKLYIETGKSKTMNSRHLDFLAADLVIFKDGMAITEGEAFRPLGLFWESLGGRWGGRFVDLTVFKVKHGRDFDSSKDLGWDTDHFEMSP